MKCSISITKEQLKEYVQTMLSSQGTAINSSKISIKAIADDEEETQMPIKEIILTFEVGVPRDLMRR